MGKEPILFSQLDLDPKILQAIDDLGFEEPSPVQVKTIPPVLAGDDVISQAQTGTGKTGAFAIPLLMKIESHTADPQVLVMTPTRELAIQVAEEFARIGKYTKTRVLPIYGGQNIGRQIRGLERGVDIAVGTPGRVLDHISRGTLKLNKIKAVVLDEADEMLDMGFINDIESILSATPKDRQMLLFSATIPRPIARLSQKYMVNPTRVSIDPEQVTAPDIEQMYYDVKYQDKLEVLCRILDTQDVESAIIFCRTKKNVNDLSNALNSRGYAVGHIHGDLDQHQRSRVMKSFRDGHLDLLVATDVAARGIDVQNISHVINYDCPQDPESYVHRIGRTGRAGRKGVAITLIQPMEIPLLRTIQRLVKVRIERKPIPSPVDVTEKQVALWQQHLIDTIATDNLTSYRESIESLTQEYHPSEIAAAALKLLVKSTRAVSGTPAAEKTNTFGDTGAEAGMVRFFINVGRKQGITPADIVRSVAEESDISGSVIGAINIFDSFTFVEVPEENAQAVFQNLPRGTIKGFKINIEPARPR